MSRLAEFVEKTIRINAKQEAVLAEFNVLTRQSQIRGDEYNKAVQKLIEMYSEKKVSAVAAMDMICLLKKRYNGWRGHK